MKNYYELLEVDKNASAEIISKVFKFHIKKNHPDLYQGEKKLLAEEKLKELNEAYEVLSDLNKKKEYDKTIKDMELNEEQNKRKELDLLRFELDRKEQIIQLLNQKYNISIYDMDETEAQSIDQQNIYEENGINNIDSVDNYYGKQSIFNRYKSTYIYDIKMFFKKTLYIILGFIIFCIFVFKLTGINIFQYML